MLLERMCNCDSGYACQWIIYKSCLDLYVTKITLKLIFVNWAFKYIELYEAYTELMSLLPFCANKFI